MFLIWAPAVGKKCRFPLSIDIFLQLLLDILVPLSTSPSNSLFLIFTLRLSLLVIHHARLTRQNNYHVLDDIQVIAMVSFNQISNFHSWFSWNVHWWCIEMTDDLSNLALFSIQSYLKNTQYMLVFYWSLHIRNRNISSICPTSSRFFRLSKRRKWPELFNFLNQQIGIHHNSIGLWLGSQFT